jgi:hypothetical protein
MKNILEFNEYFSVNELNASTYNSVMNKVSNNSDPRSFRLYKDAGDLKYKEFKENPIKIKPIDIDAILDFYIGDVRFIKINRDGDGLLEISSAKNRTKIIFDTADKSLTISRENDVNKTKCYVDRRGANIISKMLKLDDIDVRPQDIQQF